MKQFLLCLIIFFSAITLLPSCNNETPVAGAAGFNLDSVKAAIAASNKVFGECWATGDSVRFAGCYSADACLNPPNLPRMCGSKAITAFFNGGYQMGVRNIRITTEEVTGGSEIVAETGTYEMLGDKNTSLEKGKFIVLWKMENGKWKMHRDVWNSDAAPPSAAK